MYIVDKSKIGCYSFWAPALRSSNKSADNLNLHHLQVCVCVSCLCELGCKGELEILEFKKFNNLHEDIKKLYSKGNKTSLEISSLYDDDWTLLLQQMNT